VEEMTEKVKNWGQYFTPQHVAEFMVNLISKDIRSYPRVLEPCAGQGVFLKELERKGFKNIVAYEIDSTLHNNSNVNVLRQDFLSTDPNDKFDVIIGNPPYVRWKNIPKELREKLRGHPYWKDKLNGLGDLLYAFIYLSVEKLSDNGELIFITPMFWMETTHAKIVRKQLSKLGEIDLIITFNEMRIFKEVSSTIMVFKFVKRKVGKQIKIVQIHSKENLTQEILDHATVLLERLNKQDYVQEDMYEAYIHPQFMNGNPWVVIPPHIKPLIEKMEETCATTAPLVPVNNSGVTQSRLSRLLEQEDLEQYEIPRRLCKAIKFCGKTYFLPEYGSGLATGLKDTNQTNLEIFRCPRLGDIAQIGNGLVSGLDRAFKVAHENAFSRRERQKIVPVVKAKNLRRYYVEGYTPYIFVNDIASQKELEFGYPNVFEHLLRFKSKLEQRYQYRQTIPWWHWVFLRNFRLITESPEKILVPCKERIDKKGYVRFSLAVGKLYVTQDVTAIVKKPEFKEDVKYLVGILNSELILTWLKYKGLTRGGVLEFSEKPLSRIPIRLINWKNREDVEIHDKIVRLVDQILETKLIEPYHEQIESLVRKLYGVL
jgi:adenine-specific DNA-methyltransferase